MMLRMPRCFAFLLIGAVALSAQEPRDFGNADKLAIEQMYDRYTQAFIKKDYAKILECVEAPFFSFLGDLSILESMDAVAASYRGQRESLDQRAYDHTEIVEKHIVALAADRALLNTTFRRYKKDGSLLEEGAGAYLVRKSSGIWKLRGVMRQDLKYFGKIY
jgi:hypothetical protein